MTSLPKKIAILGTENSHARVFAEMIQNAEDLTLIGAYGNEEEANRNFSARFGVPVTDSPESFADTADGILVTARNGASHLALALPYFRPGMTVFVDKPICNRPAEAFDLIALARKNGVRLCGGSCLQYASALRRLGDEVSARRAEVVGGSFSAPVEVNSPYGGFLFYSPHLCQMVLSVFGNGIRSVRATRNGGSVSAWLDYDGFCVSLFFGCDTYHASVTFAHSRSRCEIQNFNVLFAREFGAFRRLLFGKGIREAEAVHLADHVVLADAVLRAYESHEEVVPVFGCPQNQL